MLCLITVYMCLFFWMWSQVIPYSHYSALSAASIISLSCLFLFHIFLSSFSSAPPSFLTSSIPLSKVGLEVADESFIYEHLWMSFYPPILYFLLPSLWFSLHFPLLLFELALIGISAGVTQHCLRTLYNPHPPTYTPLPIMHLLHFVTWQFASLPFLPSTYAWGTDGDPTAATRFKSSFQHNRGFSPFVWLPIC